MRYVWTCVLSNTRDRRIQENRAAKRNEISIELLYLHLKWFKIRNSLCFLFFAHQIGKKHNNKQHTHTYKRMQAQQPVIRAICAYTIVKYLVTESTSKSTCRKYALRIDMCNVPLCTGTLELNHFMIPNALHNHTYLNSRFFEPL